MPSQLVSSSGCCLPCDTVPLVVNVPGPQGPSGSNGTNGTNGVNVFTTTTASFIVPAIGGTVAVPVVSVSFLPTSAVGLFFVTVVGGGYFQVISIATLTVTLKNPASGVLGVANSVPGTVVGLGVLMTLAGSPGSIGATGASGGAGSAASYICRTPDGTLTNETALDALTAGYMKTAGSGGSGVVTTVQTLPISDLTGILPVAKGGTNLSSIPTNGQLLIGNGTGYSVANVTAGSGITITNGAGSISIAASSSSNTYETFTLRRASQVGITALGTPQNIFQGSLAANIDTSAGWTPSTARYTPKSTGYFRFTIVLNGYGNTGVTWIASISLYKTGTAFVSSLPVSFSTSSNPPIVIDCIDICSVANTNYYEAMINLSSGVSFWLDVGSTFSVQRIAPL